MCRLLLIHRSTRFNLLHVLEGSFVERSLYYTIAFLNRLTVPTFILVDYMYMNVTSSD